MYSPATFSAALLMTILSAVFWASWANTYKGVKRYPFELFYWDYIIWLVVCAFAFAFTLGSFGTQGEPFLANLHLTNASNIAFALVGGFIFYAANLLLVSGIEIAGLAIAFQTAIGIAVVEGVLLSYALRSKGSAAYVGIGILLAIVATLCDVKAYRRQSAGAKGETRKGIVVNVVSGILMGAYTIHHALTDLWSSFDAVCDCGDVQPRRLPLLFCGERLFFEPSAGGTPCRVLWFPVRKRQQSSIGHFGWNRVGRGTLFQLYRRFICWCSNFLCDRAIGANDRRAGGVLVWKNSPVLTPKRDCI